MRKERLDRQQTVFYYAGRQIYPHLCATISCGPDLTNINHHYTIQDNDYDFINRSPAAWCDHGYIVIVLFGRPVCPGHSFRKLSPGTCKSEYVDYKHRWQKSGAGIKRYSYPGSRYTHIRATEQHR